MSPRLLAWMLVALVAAGVGTAAARQGVSGRSGGAPPAGVAGAPTRIDDTGAGAISGVVTDGATKKPLAGVVMYLGIQGHGPAVRMSRQVTDARGRFVFPNLPASDAFFMNASKPGYNDGRYGDSGPVSGGFASGLIRLAAGQWFSEGNIPLWRPGAIGGTVLDEHGEPVVGVHVRALARILIAGAPHLAASAATTTDDRGRYRLSGLPPGSYIVSVPSVQSVVPVAATPLEIEGLTPATAGRAADPDTPTRNGGAIEVDAGHLLIVGNYPTPPLAADGTLQAYPMAFFASAATVGEATAIVLANGDSRDGIDISLAPAPAVAVSGHLVGPPEAARGLVLRLIAAGLEDLDGGSEVATTLVGPGGEFTFANVPTGSYVLIASHASLEYSYGPPQGLSSRAMPGTPGLVPGPGMLLGSINSGPAGSRMSSTHGAGDAGYWAEQPITVGGGGLAGLSIPMRPSIALRGRVAFEGTGAPPGQTAIFAEPADGRAALGMPQSSTRPSVEDDPEFTIPGFLPGEYVLRVVGLNPKQAVKSIVLDGRDVTTRPIDASGGQDLGEVVITYTDQIASIHGTVQMDGAGTRLASVIAFPATRDQWTKYGLTAARFKSAPVTNAGTFALDNIPAGQYLLVAVDSGQALRWRDPAFLEQAAKVAVGVTVDWGETKTQSLRLSEVK